MIKALVLAAVAAFSVGTAAAHETTTVHRHTMVERHDVTEGSRHHRDFDRRDHDRRDVVVERDVERHDMDRHHPRGNAYGHYKHHDRWVTKKIVKRVCHDGRCRTVVRYVKVRR